MCEIINNNILYENVTSRLWILAEFGLYIMGPSCYCYFVVVTSMYFSWRVSNI